MAQTARVFQVTQATIASWCQRLDEQGPTALLRTPVPVNKFPDFVAHLVQRLQVLCPRLGKVKIAQVLARAGLHLGVSTVGRMRRQRPTPGWTGPGAARISGRRLTSSYPNHLWHADLTTVPTSAGFWSSWLPFALPQCWPFCWWLAVVLDHYSRRVLGFRLFLGQPSSNQITQFLGQVVAHIGTAPRHLVTDRGKQFCNHRLHQWCRRQAIHQRFGAVGQRGSIAVVERFIRTLKESTRALTMVSLRRRSFQIDVHRAISWYDDVSHYTSLLCAGKIEGSLSGRRYRAPGPGAFDSPREVVSWLGFQSRAVQDPGPVSQRVVRLNFSSLYGKSQGARADVQPPGRRLQSHPALCLGMFGAVVGNSLVCAQRGYALLGPTVAAPRS
jgi:transposase InsO family protein